MYIDTNFVEQPEKHTFTIQHIANWAAIARKELLNSQTLDNLAIQKVGLTVKPYYTGENRTSSIFPPLLPSTNQYSNARQWANIPIVYVTDTPQARANALHHLQNGADGVYFQLDQAPIDIAQLIAELEWPYCHIYFSTSTDSYSFINDLIRYVEKRYTKDLSKLNGGLFWKGEVNLDLIKFFKDWNNFQSAGIIVQTHANADEEIAQALTQGVETIEKLKTLGFSLQQAFNSICFSVPLGNDFFVEIIKLRVLRKLWSNIITAYRVSPSNSLFIHTFSPAWVSESFQPHSNLIKETYAALAAILGGCDGLSIESEDKENSMMTRIARNASTILQEESFLAQVADPLAGSHFLETVGAQLAENAWSKFQILEKRKLVK